jgi:formyl-CoA transferase
MCEALGLINLPDDDRYRRNADRLKNRESLVEVLSARFEEEERDTWLKLLESVGVPCGPIQSIQKHWRIPISGRVKWFLFAPQQRCKRAPQVANPIKFSRSSIDYLRAPQRWATH